MPTDSFGQGVPYLDYSDTPDMKVLGEGIVEGVVRRSAMRFASASARDATVTAPEFGMVAALESEKILTWYDGAQWAAVAAGTQTWTTLDLASGYGHDGNANGTAQYRLVDLFGEPAVALRGGVTISYPDGTPANDGYLLATALPAAARPTTLRTVPAACSTAGSTLSALKLDAFVDGRLRIVGRPAESTPPWVSLNSILYSL